MQTIPDRDPTPIPPTVPVPENQILTRKRPCPIPTLRQVSPGDRPRTS